MVALEQRLTPEVQATYAFCEHKIIECESRSHALDEMRKQKQYWMGDVELINVNSIVRDDMTYETPAEYMTDDINCRYRAKFKIADDAYLYMHFCAPEERWNTKRALKKRDIAEEQSILNRALF